MRMMAVSGVLVLAAGLAGAACQRPCGVEGGEGSGLTVIVRDAETADGRLAAGAYTFTVTTELGALTWSCVVDAGQPDGEGCGTSQAVGAEEDAEEDVALLLAAHVTDGEFRLELSLLKPGLATGPEEVTVAVERDGEVVATQEVSPEYVLSRAGGDGCGQTYVVDEAPTVELMTMVE